MTAARRAPLAARALVSALALAAVAGAPHAAAAPAAPGPRVQSRGAASSITLASQTPWVAPKGAFEARFDIARPPRGGHLTVLLHSSLPNRSALEASIAGTEQTSVIRSLPDVALPTRTVDHTRALVALRLDDGSGSADGDRVVLGQEGVYPLEVRVVGADGVAGASVVSYLVRLPAATPAGDTSSAQPLRVATVVPVLASPAHLPDGTISVPAAARERAEAALAALRSDSDHPAPLDLVISPELLDALASSGSASDRALVTDLRTAGAARGVLPQPWVDVDLPGWLAQPGLATLLPDLVRRGATTLDARLHRPDRAAAVLGLETSSGSTVASPATLDWLRQQGIRHVLLPDDALVPVQQNLTGTQPFHLSADRTRTLTALQVDPAMQQHFATADPVLGANQIVADLAVLALDLPGVKRGAVVVPPSDRALDPALLDALRSSLDAATPGSASGARPLVDPVSVDDLFREVPVGDAGGPTGSTGTPLVRDLRSTTPNDLGALSTRLSGTSQRLLAWSQLVANTRRSRLTADLAVLRTSLAAAASRDLGPVARQRYLDAVDGHVAATGADITLPRPQTVTLTARTASIPFTIRNRMGGPITVELHLQGSGRLEFPDGATRTVVVAGEVAHLQLRVRVTTPGDTTLRVRATSPGGGLALGDTRVTIRSTAVSGVGVAITIGALLFLFLWWARHGWRARRARLARRVRPADLISVDGPPSGATPPDV